MFIKRNVKRDCWLISLYILNLTIHSNIYLAEIYFGEQQVQQQHNINTLRHKVSN